MIEGTSPTASADASEGGDASPWVVIGVLTWNGFDKASACLESLHSLREWPLPVVVVDNGSEVAEGERLVREFGYPVNSVRLDPNQGVGGGYNEAVRWAAQRGASWILLLNNDTLMVDPDMLTKLLAAAGPNIAAVGPIVLDGEGSVFSAGGELRRWLGWARHKRGSPAGVERAYEADWLDGSCILLSVDTACRIGGWAPIYQTYFEDVDWCVRAFRGGQACLVEPSTRVTHLRSGTIPSVERVRMTLRNHLVFARRHGSRPQQVTSTLFFLLVRCPALLLRSARSRTAFAEGLRAVASAIGWNVRDAARRGAWCLRPDGPDVCARSVPEDPEGETCRPN